MDTIELVATSLDEAREKAASQLGVDASAVELEVLDETKGLFGKPGKLTIRASAKSAAPAKEKLAKKAAEPAAEKPAKKPRGKEKAEVEAEAAPAEEASEKPAKRERPAKSENEGEESEQVDATQEQADQLISILNGLLETAELRATAHITKLNGRYIHIDIEGKDVSFLIGKRGEVLNALQYLLNVITARQITNGVRVVLEGDSYRERRAQTLTDMALKLAQEVRARGEEAVLDALPAFERRVIHQAIVDLEGVTTYSEGEEPNRRVVIAPSA